MEQSDLLKYVCRLFEQLGVRYLVTGSQATTPKVTTLQTQ
jgi:hypothetical protein